MLGIEGCLGLGLAPGALSKDFVEVEGHGLAGDEALNFGLQGGGENSHQGLGGETVLGALLVVTLGQVLEKAVSSLVDVVDDLAKVTLEVAGGQRLKVSQSLCGDVSLPLQLALALINDGPQLGVLGHVGLEGLGELELVSRGGDLSSGEGEVLLVIFRGLVLGKDGGLTQVSGEADQVEVLVDVVHDLGLKEGLGSVIHDFVAKLGLGNVFSQLLDTSASGLGGAIFVNDFVALPLGSLTVGELSNKLLDDLELSSEEGILGHVHLVPVHLEEVEVDSGNGLDESLVAGSELELPEEAGSNAAGGRSGKTNLAVDNDGAVDSGALQSLAHIVEVRLGGSSRVADGDSHVDKSGELLLESLDDKGEGGELLDLNLMLLLVNLDVLQLAVVSLGLALNDADELLLVLLDRLAGDVTELSILTNLVWGASTDGVAVHIHDGLLAHVQPDDLVGLGIEVAASLVDGILESSNGGLSAAVHLVSRNATEVGDSIDLLRQLLNLFEVVGHRGGLPNFRIISHG